MQSNTSITPFTYTFTSTSAFRSDYETTATQKQMQSTSRMYNILGRDISPICHTDNRYNEDIALPYSTTDNQNTPANNFYYLPQKADFHTADMFLAQSSRARLAETPYEYATTAAQQSQLYRPGGGTGVIPTPPTPVGDSLGFLLLLACLYTVFRHRRRKHRPQN